MAGSPKAVKENQFLFQNIKKIIKKELGPPNSRRELIILRQEIGNPGSRIEKKKWNHERKFRSGHPAKHPFLVLSRPFGARHPAKPSPAAQPSPAGQPGSASAGHRSDPEKTGSMKENRDPAIRPRRLFKFCAGQIGSLPPASLSRPLLRSRNK